MTVAGSHPVRVDAHDKVTGATRYGADRGGPEMVHGVFAVATIGKGRVTKIDTEEAEAVPGVRLVLGRLGEDELRSEAGFLLAGGYGVQSLQPMTDDRIAYRGQSIALAVAEHLHEAVEAAAAIRAEYEGESPLSTTLDSEGVETVKQAEAIPLPMFAELGVGDADEAFAAAPVQQDEVYDYAPQHQNPMELVATVAEWVDGRLIIHEGSQNSGGIRFGVGKQLDVDPEKIEVRSPYVGGGFGQKNSLQPQTALAAIAARRLGRPVKIVVPRSQLFHNASFRPQTRHRVRLGADSDGALRSMIYEVDQQTSRHDLFPSSHTESMSRLYAIPNLRSEVRLVRADTQTPGYMRAPYEQPAHFALESAVDELADRLELDPLELRLANLAEKDPVTGKPFSSNQLGACLRDGASRFGWDRRERAPTSMVLPDGTQVGWGMAAGSYKGSSAPAVARITAADDGRVEVEVSSHEMGQGARAAVTETVSSDLGIGPEDIACVMGDTRSVPQHVTAGSWGTAAAIPPLVAALRSLRARLGAPESGPFDLAAAVRALGESSVSENGLGPGMDEKALEAMRQGLVGAGGPAYPDFTSMSWVAHFVEVHVEPRTRRIRVRRVVSTVDCGRVISPVAAHSQVRGAVVWGIGAALRERSVPEPTYGGFLNDDLADYVVAVNADVGEIDVKLLDVPDTRLNDPGVKGLGEVSLVGVAAAIANAVFHATGRRIRHLPIALEDML